jgi:hypothetical protein
MPFRVRVERPGGFTGPIVLELSKDLGDRLDFQTWYPSPSAESADAHRLRYEFDPPEGSVFEVTLDARTAPGQPPSTSRYSISVLDDGTAVVSVQFRMTVLP